MSTNTKSAFFLHSVLIFTGLPLLILAMDNFPERSFLKESISVMTILAFCQMIGQFFWSRANRSAVKDLTMSSVIKYHKIIGYTFVAVLLFHPVFLVVPRFFESGIDPADAFITIITSFTSQGVVLGMVAWCLLLTLGATSHARKKLPIKYSTWRLFHSILALLFISVAAWHVIDIGRHSTPAMSAFISILSAAGILVLLQTYFNKQIKKLTRYQ